MVKKIRPASNCIYELTFHIRTVDIVVREGFFAKSQTYATTEHRLVFSLTKFTRKKDVKSSVCHSLQQASAHVVISMRVLPEKGASFTGLRIVSSKPFVEICTEGEQSWFTVQEYLAPANKLCQTSALLDMEG